MNDENQNLVRHRDIAVTGCQCKKCAAHRLEELRDSRFDSLDASDLIRHRDVQVTGCKCEKCIRLRETDRRLEQFEIEQQQLGRLRALETRARRIAQDILIDKKLAEQKLYMETKSLELNSEETRNNVA